MQPSKLKVSVAGEKAYSGDNEENDLVKIRETHLPPRKWKSQLFGDWFQHCCRHSDEVVQNNNAKVSIFLYRLFLFFSCRRCVSFATHACPWMTKQVIKSDLGHHENERYYYLCDECFRRHESEEESWLARVGTPKGQSRTRVNRVRTLASLPYWRIYALAPTRLNEERNNVRINQYFNWYTSKK